MNHGRVQRLLALLPILHSEHPRMFVQARRNEAISFPVEHERDDLLRMTPTGVEKRLLLDIPNPHDIAGDGQEFPVRAEGQHPDLPLMLDFREEYTVGDLPDLGLAGA